MYVLLICSRGPAWCQAQSVEATNSRSHSIFVALSPVICTPCLSAGPAKAKEAVCAHGLTLLPVGELCFERVWPIPEVVVTRAQHPAGSISAGT